jgi:hypothetical protein
MNSNTLAYIIYLLCMVFIIYRVGGMFHRNGRMFILKLYHGDEQATDTINNILLLAYYLFNMGYAFLKLKTWERIGNTAQLISSLSDNIGLLILILAITHYFNMLIIHFLSRHTTHFTG